jgi:alpha-tubulin suppressor-like RCC1 family protein
MFIFYFNRRKASRRTAFSSLRPTSLINKAHPIPATIGVVAALLLGAGNAARAQAPLPPDNLTQSTSTHLWSWGGNASGQLGDGSTILRVLPHELPPNRWLLGPDLTSLAAGKYHSLALNGAGALLSWGLNDLGQLATANTLNQRTPIPIRADGPLQGRVFNMVRSGKYHSLARDTTGALWSWGFNEYGQLGDGTRLTRNRATPVRFPGAARVETMACGGSHSLAVASDHHLYSWGNNAHGALGNGDIRKRSSTIPALADEGGALANGRLIALAAGNYHSLALDAEGRVFAWGDNRFGQLGDGTTLTRFAPIQVGGALQTLRVKSIAAGYFFSLALTDDGRLFAWGADESGQIGDGKPFSPLATDQSTLSRLLPTEIHCGATPIARVAAGFSHVLTLDSEGILWSWGANRAGQLGDGTLISRSTPQPVFLLGLRPKSRIIALAAGAEHSLIVTRDPPRLAPP